LGKKSKFFEKGGFKMTKKFFVGLMAVATMVAVGLMAVATMVAVGLMLMAFIKTREPKAADKYTCTLEYRYVENGKEVFEPTTLTYGAYFAFPDDAMKIVDGYHYYILPTNKAKRTYTAWYYRTDGLYEDIPASSPVHHETYVTEHDDIGRITYTKNTSDNLQKRPAKANDVYSAPYEPKRNRK